MILNLKSACRTAVSRTRTRKMLILSVLMLVLGGTSFAQSFQVRNAGTLKILQTRPDAESASFIVRADMRIDPNHMVIIDEPVTTTPTPTPTTPTPSAPVISNSGGGSGGEKYDASKWILGRVYDQLVKAREDEPLLASAPERPVFPKHGPPENSYIPGTQLQTSIVRTETIDQSDTIDQSVITEAPKPEKTVVIPLKKVLKTPYAPASKKDFVIRESLELDWDQVDFPRVIEEDYKLSASKPLKEAWKPVCKTLFYHGGDEFWKIIASLLFFTLIGFTLIIFLLGVLVLLMLKHEREKKREKKWKTTAKRWLKNIGLLSAIMISFSHINTVSATTTTPQLLIYEGDLLNSSGSPLGGSYEFRFSFWDNADFEPTDVVAGVLNTAASDYRGWTERQTVTLGFDGAFSHQLGTVTAFTTGLFDQDFIYLQVEVKAAASPDSSFEVIDVETSDTAIDRKIIASVPHAFNANKLDYRNVGYGTGEIPYIDEVTGQLPAGIIPGSGISITGTDANTFSIDQDGDAGAGDTLTLEFGNTIGETLSWNGITDQFELSDDFDIAGNLIVSGTINGVVVGTRNISVVLSPRYPNSAFIKDGSDNLGSMYEESDTVSGNEKNILRWESQQVGTLQDYDTIIRFPLPGNFDSFQASGISLDLKTDGGGPVDAKLDLIVEKEGTAGDQLSALGIGLNSPGVWATPNYTIGGTWVAGDIMVIKIKTYAQGTNSVHLGDIKLDMVTN